MRSVLLRLPGKPEGCFEQALPLGGLGGVLACAHIDIGAMREGLRAELSVERIGLGAGCALIDNAPWRTNK